MTVGSVLAFPGTVGEDPTVKMSSLSTMAEIIDDTFEEKVMACMFRINDFATVASQHVKPSYFSNPMRHNLAKMANEFWLKYGTTIKRYAIVDELKVLLDKKIIIPSDMRDYGNYVLSLDKIDVSDHEWVLDKLVKWIKHRELKAAITEAVSKHLPRGEFEQIEKAILAALSVSSNPEPQPYAYMSEENINAREVRRIRASSMTSIGISTGIPSMDQTLSKRGWYAKELYVIMAPTKTGKTFSLLWFANFAAKQGFNVIFFTFETSVEVLSDRMDAMNTQIETKMLNGRANHVSTILKSKKWEGEVYFCEYPTKTCTVGEMRRRVKGINSKGTAKGGRRIDMIVCDYGDLAKPSRRMDNKLDEQAGVFEDLRGLAGEFGIPVLTATQVNRAGTGKQFNDGTDVAGTFEKIMIADEVIALSALKDELKENKLRITFSESRNSERRTFLIKTNYAAGTFFDEFIKEE